ncbi:hypothetical protein ACFW0H_23110 [Pseudomonas sp. CR3202]|uniref:hypothetical protein n=1 Tax=Pseudomonas sp. CR3202 TaxID=3351532 RepID=UPI003BF10076
MLTGIAVAIIVALTSIWTAARDTGNRFVVCGTLILLTLPYELFKVSFAGTLASQHSPFALYCILIFSLYLAKSLAARRALKTNGAIVTAAAYVAFVICITFYNSGIRGFGTILDNYLAPLLALVILTNERHNIKTNTKYKIQKLICLAALYGVLEFALKHNIIYNSIFSQADWVSTQWSATTHRSTSTIGHPLLAATIYLSAVLLLNRKQRNYWPYLFILSLGILSTGSRTALVLLAASIILRTVQNSPSNKDIIAISGVTTFVVASYILGFFDQIIYRFNNSSGSDHVRLALIEYIPEMLKVSLWGRGIGSSGEIAYNIGFFNAIEIPWIALAIEIGIAGLLISFLAAYKIISSYGLWRSNLTFFAVLFIMLSSYNSISVHSPIAFFIALILFIPNKETNKEPSSGKDIYFNLNLKEA